MNKMLLAIFCTVAVSHSAFSQVNVIGSTGAVGIGTTSPVSGSWLHVYRNASGNYNPLVMLQDALSGGFTQLGLKGTARTYHIGVGNSGAAFGLSNKFFIWDQDAAAPRLVINPAGAVGIGTTNIADANYKLFVEGAIRARKIKIDADTWPDYVFEPGYNLLSLYEVEQYIKSHKHLPEIPSVDEISKNGLDVGDTQALLLKKIEELTLYLIEQNKRLDDQEKEIRNLKMQME